MPERPRARAFHLSFLAAAMVAALALTVVMTSPARASTTPGASGSLTNVVSVAMNSLHQWEGECFPWVRRVIAAATGRTIGWDYRLGYLEAGATEIGLDEVRSGDVIQFANDAATGPSVSYPGLHTAIVMENHGGGSLTVIDSNSQWDGVVRIRTGYQPITQAARYEGITARAYRFPGVAEGAFPLQIPSDTLTVGGTAIVSADGDCLRMRSVAGLGGVVLTCLPHGSAVTVLESVSSTDGFVWRQVSALGRIGWVAEQYLQGIETAPGAPPPQQPVNQPAPPEPEGSLIGTLTPSGGISLAVWDGGSSEALASTVEEQGCAAASIWATVNGSFVRYTANAPAFANGAWFQTFPGGNVPPMTPLLVFCASAIDGSPPPSNNGGTTPPPSSGGPAPAAPDGVPPGPAGNE